VTIDYRKFLSGEDIDPVVIAREVSDKCRDKPDKVYIERLPSPSADRPFV